LRGEQLDHLRPDPDQILASIQNEDKRKLEGHLRIFIGMSAGVGKTYAMLEAAHVKKKDGSNVVIGIIETHGRADTEDKVHGLTLLARKRIEHRGVILEEMDLDEIIKLKPQIVLVDELAHTNAPGSRHPKRWQDVIEILENGIDVYSTLNIQHIESRKDDVENITDVVIHETVPDLILERADHIEVIDIPPIDLLKRLEDGKVYLPDKAEQAKENFFKTDKLTALRQILLRFSADKVDAELQTINSQKLKGKVWKTQEKILLAVGHGPESEKLVRAAKQMATNLRCPWYAAYIDTGDNLLPLDQKTLSRNMDLARDLGARVLTTSEENIVSGIDRVCRQNDITQVVIGQPGFQPIKNFFRGGSLLDKLLKPNSLSNQVTINLVKTRSSQSRFKLPEKVNQFKHFKWYPFLLATVFVIFLGLFNKFILDINGLLPYRSIGMVFLLGVTFCGLFLPLGATIWASLLSVQIWNVFFIPPLYTFHIDSPDDITLAISFFFTATVTGALTSIVRKNQNLIRDQEARTAQLYSFSQLIVESQSKDECIENLTKTLAEYLQANVAITLRTELGTLDYFKRGEDWIFNRTKEWAAAHWSFENRKVSGKWTDTLPDSSAYFVPLVTREDIIGVLGINPHNQESSLLINDREFIFSLTSQLALYLQRELYYESAIESEKLKKSEKLHQTLMNSVSHEIKTPLTAITGIVDALGKLDNKDSDSYRQLNKSLHDSVDRLKRIVDNILDVSRLESGVLTLKEDWFSIEEIIDNVLFGLRVMLVDFKVVKEIPSDFPLVFIDGRIYEQILFNLVLNSAKYSLDKKVIKFQLSCSSESWQLQYSDEGPGVSPDFHKYLFDKFYRVPGTKTGGSGLGLGIVKSLVELHKGEIKVSDSKPGLSFIISLPLYPPPIINEENL
jgi:two-component system, OmpR family, sensor histidine kinase KdpD